MTFEIILDSNFKNDFRNYILDSNFKNDFREIIYWILFNKNDFRNYIRFSKVRNYILDSIFRNYILLKGGREPGSRRRFDTIYYAARGWCAWSILLTFICNIGSNKSTNGDK